MIQELGGYEIGTQGQRVKCRLALRIPDRHACDRRKPAFVPEEEQPVRTMQRQKEAADKVLGAGTLSSFLGGLCVLHIQ